MKRITISISDSMYNEIKSYLGDLAPTKNGIIWILLEHGLNYEWKKHRKKEKESKEKRQELQQEATADTHQENNSKSQTNLSKEDKHNVEIATGVMWANGEYQ